MLRLLTYVGFVMLLAVSSAEAEEWSKPVGGLTGQLKAETVGGKVKLIVELKNEGVLPYRITTHDPFSFDLIVKDAKGERIKPDCERADILSSPQAAILPRECKLTMPVTLIQEKNWNLDIVTKLWALKPGKYKLSGKYSILADQKEPQLTGEAYTWKGELQLPPIEIEIR